MTMIKKLLLAAVLVPLLSTGIRKIFESPLDKKRISKLH